jgi:hypothetical protein
MHKTLALLAVVIAFSSAALYAQTSAPMVVQAAPGAAMAPAAAAPAASAASPALQLLQAMKAANQETLKKQEATLIQLDELQKAADQIKIFTKRG